MAIVLNTELCWPLAAVGPSNAVVELFEHAGRGVSETMSVIRPSCQPYFSQRMYTLRTAPESTLTEVFVIFRTRHSPDLEWSPCVGLTLDLLG